MQDDELIPGVMLNALGASERLLVGALRMAAAGRGKCPRVGQAFHHLLGAQGNVAARGTTILAYSLATESARKLTLGWLCVRGVTWDEAAILAVLEAAQRSAPEEIARWLVRLGVSQPSAALQRGIAWTAAGFAAGGKPFDADVAQLTRASTSRMTSIRDQIETQTDGRGFFH